MITYPTRSIHTLSSSSTAQRSDLYWAYIQQKLISPVVDLSMRGAIQGGIFSDIYGSTPVIPPTCSSSNCTWDSFSSLEVCFKTANVTDKLHAEYLSSQKVAPNVTVILGVNVTLPNGAWLQAGAYNPFGLSTPFTGSAKGSLASSDIPNINDTVIANSFMIYNTLNTGGFLNQSVELYSAIELMIYWCVKTHSSQVISGIPSTNTTAISTYVRSTNASYDSSSTNTDLRPVDFDIIYNSLNMSTDAKDTNNYTVEGKSNKILAESLAKTLSGYIVVSPFSATTNAAEVMNSVLWAYPRSEMSFQQARDFQMRVASNFTSNIAISISNNIRGRSSRGNAAVGLAQTSESFVKVRWAWLAYLLCLLMLSIIFLSSTMIKSSYSQVHILKSSALAAMAGFSAASHENMRRAEMRGKMWQKAQNVKVRFVKAENGWEMRRHK